MEEQRAGRLAQRPLDLAMTLRTAGQGVLEPVWHELVRLDLPLLAIAGARDEGYVAAARRIADTAPRGRAEIVEEAGHARAAAAARRGRAADRGVPGGGRPRRPWRPTVLIPSLCPIGVVGRHQVDPALLFHPRTVSVAGLVSQDDTKPAI